MPKKKSTPEKKKLIDKLTSKQQEFFWKYIEVHRNATKAYKILHPNATNNTCMTNSSKILRNAQFKAALQEYLDEIWKQKESKISDLFDKLLIMAGADIDDYLDEEGNIDIAKFKEIGTYPIVQYEKTTKTTKNGDIDEKPVIKIESRMAAINLLSKMLGMVKGDDETKTIEIVIKPAEEKDEDEDILEIKPVK